MVGSVWDGDNGIFKQPKQNAPVLPRQIVNEGGKAQKSLVELFQDVKAGTTTLAEQTGRLATANDNNKDAQSRLHTVANVAKGAIATLQSSNDQPTADTEAAATHQSYSRP